MRLRTLIGFGIGYALGARSDTKRFDDMGDLVATIKDSPIFHAIVQQAKQAAGSGMQTLTGQEPPWSKAGNGGQAKAQAQQSSSQVAQESEESEEETEGEEEKEESEAKESGNGGGRSTQRTSSKQSSSSS